MHTQTAGRQLIQIFVCSDTRIQKKLHIAAFRDECKSCSRDENTEGEHLGQTISFVLSFSRLTRKEQTLIWSGAFSAPLSWNVT